MEKFNADWNKRLSKEVGKDIINNAILIGEGGHEKDCYWSGYEKDGSYYISLNDDYEAVWHVQYSDIEDYIL